MKPDFKIRKMLSCYALIAVVAACIFAPASAFWQSRDSNYNMVAPGGVAYRGPGDVVSGATGFWSCARAYNLAYANGTNPLCDLKDKTTGTVSICTLRISTTGFADLTGSYCVGSTTPTLACAAAAGGACVVSQMYDQTGNANHQVQATAARMPALTFSALGGLPGITLIAATPQFFSTAGNITLAPPYSMTGVVERTASFTTLAPLMGSLTSNEVFGYQSLANTATIGDNNGGTHLNASASDSVFHALQGLFNGASSAIMVDGVDTTGTVTNNTMAGTFRIARWVGNSSIDGIIMEAGLWPSAFSAGDRTAINSNQHGAANGYNF